MASRRHKTIKIVYAYLIAGSLFLAAAILIFFLTIQLMNIGKISRGVKAAGVELGGLSREQAKELLDRETGEYRQSVLSFVYQDRQFNSDFDGLGIVFNNGVLIQSAYEIGRGPNSFLGLFEQLRALFGYYNLGLDYAIDSAKFREFLQTISRLETPAKDATLMFDEKKQDFIVVEEKSGLIIDRKRLRAELEFNLSNLRRNAINVSLVEDAPEITANETEAAKVQAKEILAQAPYSLKFEDKKWTLNKDLLLGWFNFAAVAEAGSGNKILGADFDSEAVEKYLAVLSQSINREPINAQFEFKNSRVTAFALGQDGRRLNVEKSGEEIVENLKNRRKTIVLAVQIIEPEITAKKADELGIKGLLGRGVSDFSGSPKNRRENIRIGAAKFHGILLKPGEEFSFNKLLGEVGPKQGYLPELVIKRNKTVPEYGGGLCQVSTTAFRAAVNSGTF
ncbi:MAG: VanW family protein [Candidatus Azambacteria bacterium GW2011_GWA2_45_90]|uniref:VanW family protein n=1 Tax=Candidatus Azambacteria bacterium GW2011_GWA2_45_90 TaxID=1618614 RepID=A0A0G1NAM1_9BACT|nr:MAG: VanW family protein [Candidatus Azambacteria bacterium GW2011_GWA2_45_90]